MLPSFRRTGGNRNRKLCCSKFSMEKSPTGSSDAKFSKFSSSENRASHDLEVTKQMIRVWFRNVQDLKLIGNASSNSKMCLPPDMRSILAVSVN